MNNALPISAELANEIAAFRLWAEALPPASRSAEWEIEHEGWPALLEATVRYLDASDPRQWDQSVANALLYVLARDNGCETIKEELVKRPNHLLVLSIFGRHSTERDARWQLADALGDVEGHTGEVTALLTAYRGDSDEYVRRRARLASGRPPAPAGV